MSTFRNYYILPISCFFISFAAADTITLKNGDVYDGKVIRQNDETVTLEINVTRTIKDERTIAKADIESIDRKSTLDKDFDKVKGFVPTPSQLPEEEYTRRIAALEKFIEAYPRTRNGRAAEKILATLQEERSTIRSGGLKVGKRLFSASEYEANAFAIDAEITEEEIREELEGRRLVEALRLFEEYEKEFGAAEARRELTSLILPALRTYKTDLLSSLASLDRRIARRKAGLELMAPEDRAVTERAISVENNRLDARYELEKASKMTWVTPDAFHKESLTSNVDAVEDLTKRLTESPPVAAGGDESLAEFYRISHGKIGSAESAEKETVLGDAKKRGLPQKYIEILRKHGEM